MAVAMALICICSSPATTSAQDGSLRRISLQLKWTHQFQFAGYYAAKAKGFYRQAGLDVELKERTQGVRVLDEVMSGRSEFGVSNTELLLDYTNDIPVVTLGAIFQHSPDVIITHGASGITNPRDLRGKRVMLLGTTAAPLLAMLTSQGVTEKDIELQELSWTTDGLVKGETDAMSAYITDQPYNLRQAGIPVNILRPQNYGVDFYGDTIFTTAELAGKEPELVEAFLKASYKGWEYAMANPDEIINIIRFKYKPNRTLGQLRHEADAMHELILPKLVEVGSMSRKRWEHIAGTYRMLGMIKGDIDLDGFLYTPQEQRVLQSIAEWTPYSIGILIVVLFTTFILVLLNRRLRQNVVLQHRQVEHSQQNLHQIMDLVPSLIYVKDSDGRFLLLNRAMADSLGATADDLMGAVHQEVHPDMAEAHRMQEDDMAVINTGLPKVNMEEPYFHADGTTHWLQSTRLPFSVAGSDEEAVLALCVDITNRRQADAAIKESEERFRAIFNQTYQFTSMLNLDGDIIQANQTALNAFNVTENDILNKPFRKAPWWPQDNKTQTFLGQAVVRASSGEVVQDDIAIPLPDGAIINIDFTLKPARNKEGKTIFLIAEGRDITRLKKSEDELRELNEELELRVMERTKNLEEAKAELTASIKELKRTQEDLILAEKHAALGGLVAGVAHEINTPLGVGVTASSFLDEKMRRLKTKFQNGELKKSDLDNFLEMGSESCTNILTNLGRAAELVKSFKQVAADQSSEIPRPFHLKEYVDEVLVSLKPKFKRTGHVVENHCPDIELYSYPGAFMQIITNLLVNSLTHAYGENEYGRMRIGGRVRGNTLTFTYDDNGCGIPPENLDKIFEPFYTTKRGQGGTGLGLHIVFNIINHTLGGSIHVESEVGGGTHFAITIPLDKETP